MTAAYNEVAEKLSIPRRAVTSANIPELVQRYLSQVGAGQWLLVFDNADDIDLWTSPLFPESGSKCLTGCLPRSPQGSIIFTTRDRKVAVRLFAHQNVVYVPEMDEAGATQMLQKRLINPALVETNGSVLATLLQKLTYLPLAIVQTAAYVNETGISLSEYEQLLSDQEDDAIELLSEEFGDDGRYDDREAAWTKASRHTHQHQQPWFDP